MTDYSTSSKAIYRTYHDQIIAKRFRSPYAIRRYAHEAQYQSFVDLVPAGSTVLDAGCGEGVLSVLLAKKGCRVTGIDISEPNVDAAKRYAEEQGVSDRATFLCGDSEHLPVPDKSFDYVVSSHVLEHLPDFDRGARELARVARVRVIIAIPTCLNLCAWVLLGGDTYWAMSRRTPYALLWGLLRVLLALVSGGEGVDEGYAGHPELTHIWRFPRRGQRALQEAGLQVLSYRGSSYVFPYLSLLLPLTRFLDRAAWWPGIRNFGYGTTYVCVPRMAPERDRDQAS